MNCSKASKNTASNMNQFNVFPQPQFYSKQSKANIFNILLNAENQRKCQTKCNKKINESAIFDISSYHKLPPNGFANPNWLDQSNDKDIDSLCSDLENSRLNDSLYEPFKYFENQAKQKQKEEDQSAPCPIGLNATCAGPIEEKENFNSENSWIPYNTNANGNLLEEQKYEPTKMENFSFNPFEPRKSEYSFIKGAESSYVELSVKVAIYFTCDSNEEISKLIEISNPSLKIYQFNEKLIENGVAPFRIFDGKDFKKYAFLKRGTTTVTKKGDYIDVDKAFVNDDESCYYQESKPIGHFTIEFCKEEDLNLFYYYCVNYNGKNWKW